MSANGKPEHSDEDKALQQAWHILIEGGVPLGAAHPRLERPSPGEMASAVRFVMASHPIPQGIAAEALYATLCAWQAHFPASFASELSSKGVEFIQQLEATTTDANRYLKLRRIALAHLAGTL